MHSTRWPHDLARKAVLEFSELQILHHVPVSELIGEIELVVRSARRNDSRIAKRRHQTHDNSRTRQDYSHRDEELVSLPAHSERPKRKVHTQTLQGDNQQNGEKCVVPLRPAHNAPLAEEGVLAGPAPVIMKSFSFHV
jgi:hypothetical protein